MKDYIEEVKDQIKNNRVNGANVGLTKDLEIYHAGVVENIVINALQQAYNKGKEDRDIEIAEELYE